jgi:hypothetical protein
MTLSVIQNFTSMFGLLVSKQDEIHCLIKESGLVSPAFPSV